MKNPEEAIERVLAGMRGAEAPAGMESRILRAMETRAIGLESGGWWQHRTPGRGYGWRLGIGAVAVAVCGLAVFGFATRDKGHIGPHAPSVRVVAIARSLDGRKEAVPQRLKPHDRSVGFGTAEAVPLSKTVEPSGTRTVEPLGEVEGHVDYDSLAVSEMLAPSMPAPPLPLTQQEGLMMRVLRHGARAEQLAMLDPVVRARDAAQSETEFHSFFDPPPLNPNE